MVELHILGNKVLLKETAFGPKEYTFAKVVAWQGDASKLQPRTMENAAWWGIASHEISAAELEKTSSEYKGYAIPNHAMAMALLRLGPVITKTADWQDPCKKFIQNRTGRADKVNWKAIPEPPAKLTDEEIKSIKEQKFTIKWKNFVEIFGKTKIYKAYKGEAAGRVQKSKKLVDDIGSFF